MMPKRLPAIFRRVNFFHPEPNPPWHFGTNLSMQLNKGQCKSIVVAAESFLCKFPFYHEYVVYIITSKFTKYDRK